MKLSIREFLTRNWKQYIISLIAAVFVWSLVNHSITTTRTIPNVQIKIINLPEDKTSKKLLPSGHLMQRISLTIKGRKSILEKLKPEDLEIVLDASDKPDDWLIDIDKKNLVSKNPDIDLVHNISTVHHNELFIRLSKLVTEEIEIHIRSPIGEPPPGYQWLDVWPQDLKYTVSGPKEEVLDFKSKGTSLVFDLGNISKDDLDELETDEHPFRKDEVVYYVPDSWKHISVPFYHGSRVPVDTPEAEKLQITFLKKQFIPIDRNIPLRVFFPTEHISSLNPENCSFAEGEIVSKGRGVSYLTIPLFAGNVSKLFLDIVSDNIELFIIAAPNEERETLRWTIQFIDVISMENKYVSMMMDDSIRMKDLTLPRHLREKQLRDRFKKYMGDLEFYKANENSFRLDARLQDDSIILKDVSGVGLGQ
ncbi:MAG: hypothetical protein HN411_04150 [Waddliaceae bacterium]|jgi:hypothetical protein|nr:hypothetical protein [Waddliaceae bacterium]MBT3578777.1 hypothetical protein [Waddliaceae bacterium]MBT4445324.1 hypothetical protein [Waddliaceae bacterium]MBT6928620.1 hypothetical protein [Waddliaceae bacterium]MBT7265116.1 hypothetical protein [Waddliaceae bacterium]